jgi:hypothetical protein
MSRITPEEGHAWLERWRLASEAETAELRRTPLRIKFEQLAALVASRHLFHPDPDRERQAQEVRERWLRLRRALGG